MKKQYQWILFDADKTLFHFDDFAGLQLVFAPFGISFSKEDYQAYHALNKPLWVQYQNGKITAEQVQHRRFDPWACQLKMPAAELNRLFLEAMAQTCAPLEGAIDLLNALQEETKLGIITNGFTALQQKRLERTKLHNHFDIVVISEEVGAAKPHPDIFDHALERMGNPIRNKVLMVGDTPESDILGGINAGFDTCWLNTHGATVPEGIVPTYEVSCLKELQELLMK